MYTRFFSLLLITLAPVLLQAQLANRVMNKVKNKVAQRVDNKVDKEIDKALDELEGKDSGKKAQNNTTTEAPATKGLQSYAKYDFVPGEAVIYSNEFETDNGGEMPTGWNTDGNGAVVTYESLMGNWVQFCQNSTYLTDNTDSFTQNYTVEFDLLLHRNNAKLAFPQLVIGMLASGDASPGANALLKNTGKNFALELKVQPADYNGSHLHLQTIAEGRQYLGTDIKRFSHLQELINQPVHVAIQVQNERLRIWLNEEKAYDLPKAIVSGTKMNQLFFQVKRYGGKDNEVGYAVTNIKIARGIPDTRHKLIDEGRFSTTGIQFESNSASIKSESSGVLKEIADLLKKQSTIRLQVVGHTDSSGTDASNLELSQKRAAAVKTVLTNNFGISPDRIDTAGKGAKEPVADNTTRQGRAQNRRVEFIKL